MDCIFCKILAGSIPSEKIFEDDEVMAFLDIQPVNKGHTLVIPKTHSPNFLEIDDLVLENMITRVKKVALAVKKATGAAGINVSANTGKAADQTVFHLHFHIIPRFDSDGLQPWPHSESEPKSRKDLAEEIKKHI